MIADETLDENKSRICNMAKAACRQWNFTECLFQRRAGNFWGKFTVF